jgi:hypothetical protein
MMVNERMIITDTKIPSMNHKALRAAGIISLQSGLISTGKLSQYTPGCRLNRLLIMHYKNGIIVNDFCRI